MPKATNPKIRTEAAHQAPQQGQDTISGQLRRALKARPETVYRLAKMTGVDTSIIARFLSGERSLSLDTVDRIARALKLRLVAHGDENDPM